MESFTYVIVPWPIVHSPCNVYARVLMCKNNLFAAVCLHFAFQLFYFFFCSFLCVRCILGRSVMVCFLFSYYFGHFDSFMFVSDGIHCRILILVHCTVLHFSHSVFFLFIVGLIYTKDFWKWELFEIWMEIGCKWEFTIIIKFRILDLYTGAKCKPNKYLSKTLISPNEFRQKEKCSKWVCLTSRSVSH